MTKRKTTQKQPTQAPTEAVESVKAESKAKVASKPKQANSTVKKAPAKPRARSKKTVVESHFKPTEENLNKLVESSEAAYQKYKETGELSGTTRVVDPEPPKYEQFKAWLVFKLYHYTSYFRGF